MGYVGAIDGIRNVHLLVDALKNLVPQKNVRLVLIGTGPAMSFLKKVVRDLALDDKVMFAGAVPYLMVPRFMRAFDVACDLTCFPMEINNTVINCSFSQKIAQYLACGRPVIAWDCDDTKFIEQEKIGRLAEMGNGKSLREAISFILSLSKDEKQEMEQRARSYALNVLSIGRLTDRRLELWRNCIAGTHK